jgi:hypothetical protein
MARVKPGDDSETGQVTCFKQNDPPRPALNLPGDPGHLWPLDSSKCFETRYLLGFGMKQVHPQFMTYVQL